MIRLYFVRHGETVWNTESRYQGMTDIELSKNGVIQAQYLAKRFETMEVDEIYSSPLVRAYDTAKAVADVKGMEVISLDELKEINFGEWEGKTVKDLQKEYGDTYMDFIKNPHLFGFPGEGSLENVIDRLSVGLNKIIETGEGKNILIVSHGGIISLCIMYLMGLDNSYFTKMWINNTGLSIIEIKGGRRLMLTVNDSSHALEAANDSNFLKP